MSSFVMFVTLADLYFSAQSLSEASDVAPPCSTGGNQKLTKKEKRPSRRAPAISRDGSKVAYPNNAGMNDTYCYLRVVHDKTDGRWHNSI